MKKYITTIALFMSAFSSSAQTSSNNILIRHDTASLKTDECEWIIKSLVKNHPSLTSEIGKPLPQVILEAIEKGKLKAIDPETNAAIPAKEIFTWKIVPDTVMLYDTEGNGSGGTGFSVIKRTHSPDNFNEVRIYQDWYFDISTGRFHSVIKWVELREDVRTSQGMMLGTAAFCRVYY